MEKEIKIQVPEGYEIDKEKSTFENIVFKKKESINCWEDLKPLKGYFISLDSNICHYVSDYLNKKDKNIFLSEKYAKSALALAQISQLLPYYDSNVDWNRDADKYCILRIGNKIHIDRYVFIYHPLAFKSLEEAERFLKYNEQLVNDYFML